MKAKVWTDEMIYDIDKMPVLDFSEKYNINRNAICAKRKKLGIKNKGEFNPRKKKIEIVNGIEMLLCSKCKILLPINKFSKDKRSYNGFESNCVECGRKRNIARNDTEAQRKYQREYKRNKRKNSDVRIFSNIRRGITRFIKKKDHNFGKSKYLEILGCSIDEFKKHLESQFDEQMTWDNYGNVWHVDHIIPRRAFTVEQLKECWNYKNLQPLLAQDNFRKNDRLPNGKRARDL